MNLKHDTLRAATGLAVTALAFLAVVSALPVHQVIGASGARVQVEAAPSDTPLLITNMREQYGSNGLLQHIDYMLVNGGSQKLTGAQISWSLKFANGSTPRVVQYTDYWSGETGPLAVGASDPLEVAGLRVAGKSGAPEVLLTSATATITYAEFEDGTRLGPNAAAASSWFSSERHARLAAYRKLLDAYRAGGATALSAAFETASPADTQADRGSRRVVGEIYRTQGVAGAVAELQRVLSLKLPPGTAQ
jgi:hypothetical protein